MLSSIQINKSNQAHLETLTLVMISESDLATLIAGQQEILKQLKELRNSGSGASINNITAKEFMSAVRIGRTKFDQLVLSNKIKVIRKRRKLYVPVGEVDRYFKDPSIQ